MPSPDNEALPHSRSLDNQRILIFVDEIYEDLELWYPKLRLIEAGARVTVAGPAAEQNYAGKHGYPCRSDARIADQQAADYDGLVVPGGFMPDKLRRDPHVLGLVRDFAAAGKLVAAICHGGWIPISAGVYRGVRVTGSPGIKDDLVNAGAIWEDAPLVVDRHFVSSRKPDDLPEFCRGILQVLSAGNFCGPFCEPTRGDATHHGSWGLYGLGVLAVPLFVALNGFFVAAEFALVSLRRTRLEEMLNARKVGAQSVQARPRASRRYDRGDSAGHHAGQFGAGLGGRTLHRAGHPASARCVAFLLVDDHLARHCHGAGFCRDYVLARDPGRVGAEGHRTASVGSPQPLGCPSAAGILHSGQAVCGADEHRGERRGADVRL